MNLMILWLIDKNDLKGETWEKEWFSEGQLKLDLWSPIHREKTLAMHFWLIYIHKELQSRTKKGIASVDRCKRNIFIYLFMWPILKQCT